MADSKTAPLPTLMLGPGRLSFPSLLEPRQNEQGGLRFEATILLPPTFNTQPAIDALHAAAVAEWGKDEKAWPKRMRLPEDVVRDCAEKSFAGYQEGWSFIAAALPGLDKQGKPRSPPQVLNAIREKVTDPREIYAGRWCKLAVRPYAYTKPQQGVTFAIVAVQLLKHDDPFGGVDAKGLFDDEIEDIEV